MSLDDSAGEAGVSTRLALASVKPAGAVPPFWMLTVPEVEPPGLSRLTLKIDWPASESVTTIVPVEMTSCGLAEVELKFAPDPSATALAATSPPSAISIRRGVARRCDVRERTRTVWPVQSAVVARLGDSRRRRGDAGAGSATAPPPATIGASNQATRSASGRGRLK